MRDDEIDTSEIPELTDEQWRDLRRPDLYRPLKRSITIRLDADVIEWFKDHTPEGGSYQAEINRVLRHHVARTEREG